MRLDQWLPALQARFDQREQSFMQVHHALVQVQLKDPETGRIEMHDIRYSAKDAPELKLQQEASHDPCVSPESMILHPNPRHLYFPRRGLTTTKEKDHVGFAG